MDTTYAYNVLSLEAQSHSMNCENRMRTRGGRWVAAYRVHVRVSESGFVVLSGARAHHH
jgi:hypothetical protein